MNARDISIFLMFLRVKKFRAMFSEPPQSPARFGIASVFAKVLKSLVTPTRFERVALRLGI